MPDKKQTRYKAAISQQRICFCEQLAKLFQFHICNDPCDLCIEFFFG